MSLTKIQVIKPKKTFKDSFTNTNYKRPFILEKFFKDLHSTNIQSIINNRSKDPLMKKKKEIKKIKIPRKLKVVQKVKELSFSRNKTPFLHLIPNLHQFKRNFDEKKIKKKLIRQRSDFDLPIIARHKILNQPVEEEKTTMTFFDDNTISNSKEHEKSNNENFVNSEMMEAKDLYKNISRKLSICSFMNKLPGDKSLQENYKIINDVNAINDKYNLKLNLNHNKSSSTSKIFDRKKYNIYGMLNKLFQYYSSEENNKINKKNKYISSINYNYKNSSSNFDSIEIKKSNKFAQSDEGDNTVEIMKDTYEDESNTFLTKLKNYNIPTDKKGNEFNISNFIKRRYSLGDIKKNNEQVIKNDKNIGIHCLLSKVQKDISLKKILYKYIDKTLYEFENDSLYKRVKEFEEKIEKILKNDY